MAHHRSTVFIEAPPEAVWKVLTRAERRPEWEAAITEVRDVSGPMDEVGARWVEVREERGKAAPAQMEVTQVDKPRFIEWTGPLPAGGKLFFRVILEPRDGGTDKTVEAEARLPFGPVGRLFDKIAFQKQWTRLAERHGTTSDANLKALVESEYASPSA
jgi:uncharacterized protein YndB with AHSA1/START domain